ncbi:MAG: ABC transporter ATP-binding protein [Lachnospira sp.]|nr:ABC transporter ATP-binding protein [Lachnospira sp.]
MEAVKLTNVEKIINGDTILSGVNITIKQGEIVGFEGRNGSGKSVLFKMIAGVMIPTNGEIAVFDEVLEKGRFPEDIGVSLDNTGFLPSLSAVDNLRTIADVRGIIGLEEIKHYIELVGLNSASKKKVGKFSVGMKQRLAFAQAIMESPKLLLLDEPFSGLDEDGVILVRKLIKDMNEKDGATVLITSHIKEDIEALCTRIFRVASGKVSLTSAS